jgi:hypothetical protein
MIDLYYWSPPNDRKISIPLMEMDLHYNFISIDWRDLALETAAGR